MNILPTQRIHRLFVAVCFCVMFTSSSAQESQSKTVIGPSNLDLYNGANALLAGDGEEGVRLTLIGLRHASNSSERQTGMSNLCAGYILLEQLDEAISYCDKVIEHSDRNWRAFSNRALAYIKLGRYDEAELDLQKAEALTSNSRKVKIVRSMLLDATDPVAPHIVIDDRQLSVDDDVE